MSRIIATLLYKTGCTNAASCSINTLNDSMFIMPRVLYEAWCAAFVVKFNESGPSF